MADHPLRSATDRRLGGPLPRQQANQTRVHPVPNPTAASRRSLDRVSVPMWPITLSGRLLIVALVGRYPANKLIRRGSILYRKIFDTAASRRSLDRVSVPMWPITLSGRLLIVALVGRYPANKLIRRGSILYRKIFDIKVMRLLYIIPY